MPVEYLKSYQAPFWQFNGHIQSIYPSMFRKMKFSYTERERLELPDGDFVDLDWFAHPLAFFGQRRLVILTHGLEGNSQRQYILGAALRFAEAGFDVLAWNCRSCSGEINRKPKFYHHGDTEDLRCVIDRAISVRKYQHISLVGFSLGGSLSLRIAGDPPDRLPSAVKSVIGFSVPCDLKSSAVELSKPGKKFYQDRFLRKLGGKLKIKSTIYPDLINCDGFEKIRDFETFDNRYTAPLHGFTDAAEFYEKASVKNHLASIKVPALLVQAANDPFLTKECLALDEANGNPYLKLEILNGGGHCGFMQQGQVFTWAEDRAVKFAMHAESQLNALRLAVKG